MSIRHLSMQIKETFGEFLRKLREDQDLPIRKVAANLDIDSSTLSKIERGERSASKDLVKKAASFFNQNEQSLMIRFLSDKVAYQIIDEESSEEILKVAEQEIKYLKSKRFRQSELPLSDRNENN
ncbi:MAG: helix-turn-helix transcriptional regulator [Bacteroidota bacterium]